MGTNDIEACECRDAWRFAARTGWGTSSWRRRCSSACGRACRTPRSSACSSTVPRASSKTARGSTRWSTPTTRPGPAFSRCAADLGSLAPDAAILLTNSLRSALTMRLCGIRRIYGYRRQGRGVLLTGGPTASPNGKITPIPMGRYYLEICRWLGLDVPQQPRPTPVYRRRPAPTRRRAAGEIRRRGRRFRRRS